MDYELLLKGLSRTLQRNPLARRKGGRELVYTCPSCMKDKLHVNPKKRKWYCFYEATGGEIPVDVIPHPAINAPDVDDDDSPDLDDLELPEDSVSLDDVSSELTRTLIYEYLEDRNLSTVQIKKYAYYSPEQPSRVILRSTNQYWAARRVPTLGASGVPYINPPGHKLCWITGPSDCYIVCEGPFDAMAYERAGFPAAALLGSDLSPTQLNFLSTLTNIALILDSKTSKKAYQIYQRLKFAGPGRIELFFFDLLVPGRKDPGETDARELRRRCEASRIASLVRPTRT